MEDEKVNNAGLDLFLINTFGDSFAHQKKAYYVKEVIRLCNLVDKLPKRTNDMIKRKLDNYINHAMKLIEDDLPF